LVALLWRAAADLLLLLPLSFGWILFVFDDEELDVVLRLLTLLVVVGVAVVAGGG
jgi:hypothetical protein